MKRSPMSPMSAKRRAQLPERAAVKQAAHERDAWRCQFWPFYDRVEHTMPLLGFIREERKEGRLPAAPIACGGIGLEAHEIIPRSAWAAGWLVLDNIASLCPRHHQWVTEHPEAAHAIGLHGFSYERPDVQR